jgi:hypothetical protein
MRLARAVLEVYSGSSGSGLDQTGGCQAPRSGADGN